MRTRTKLAATVLAALMFAGTTAAAITPAQKCEAGKKDAAGKYAACRLKAESKFVKDADTAKRSEAYTKCQTKFFAKLEKLDLQATEVGSACPTNMDGDDIQTYLAQCSDTVATATAAGGGFPECGDDEVNQAGEQCDGTDLDGTNCASLGFAGGTLSCSASCNFDTSACTVPADDCGNGTIDGAEECDQNDIGSGTCVSEGFIGGRLTCTTGCVYDTGGCYSTRFTDSGDGGIVDHETGLEWEKKIKRGGGVDLANPHDADNGYYWANRCTGNTSKYCQPSAAAAAACAAGVEGDALSCAQCGPGEGTCTVGVATTTMWQWVVDLNTANFAGSNDWRIPTRAELETILDLSAQDDPAINVAFNGASCGTACTNIGSPACACGSSEDHWTATTFAGNATSSWIVAFLAGTVDITSHQFGEAVRAVRGGN